MTIERVHIYGTVFDELVADEAHVHIERMSNDHIWMAVESDGKRLVLNFSAHKRSLNVTIANEPPAYSAKETKVECDCVDYCNGPDTTDRQCRAENGTF